MKIFINKMKGLQNFLEREVYEVIGSEAVSHYRASFRKQGFTDSHLAKWKDVKRRTNPRDKTKASAQRPILTGTGELGNSIRYRRAIKSVEIYSDKIYAKVHNEGGRAGRGKGFTMPQRQFIGKSAVLSKSINRKLSVHFKSITK